MPQRGMEKLKILGIIAIAVVLIDVLGFMAWVWSGQIPADGFYIGAITANIIKAII